MIRENTTPPLRRQDKLPSLPKKIKDEICRKINDGVRGVDIIDWLHDQPEVPFIVRPQNVSKFKTSPYFKQWKADYIKAERRAAEMLAVGRVAERICEANTGKSSEASAAIVSGTLLSMVDAFEGFDPTDPESLAKAHEFLKMVDRQRARDIAAEKLALERERLNLAKDGMTLTKERLALEIHKAQMMAAKAILDKALSDEVQAIAGSKQPDEEKTEAIAKLLFGDYQPYVPEYVD